MKRASPQMMEEILFFHGSTTFFNRHDSPAMMKVSAWMDQQHSLTGTCVDG
jgi:hypothetical protein